MLSGIARPTVTTCSFTSRSRATGAHQPHKLKLWRFESVLRNFLRSHICVFCKRKAVSNVGRLCEFIWFGDIMFRPDRNGTHQAQFRSNKKSIYATQTVCGICGKPVDFSLKYPHPLSPCIDHIIPVAKGGHPSDMANLQLAHWCCNRQKSDKLVEMRKCEAVPKVVSNRDLPHTCDWRTI